VTHAIGTASESLGLAPGARVLILNNDDFGMYHAVNVAVVRSIEEGIASSCSLMVPCPWALHAMTLLRQRPEIGFGVHLTLICDTSEYRWRPLTSREKVRSLLNADGELFDDAQTSDLMAQARLDELETEFRAQVEAVLSAGLEPTHLDWHCLHDGGREDVFDLTVALGTEYGVPVRVSYEPARRTLRALGLPTSDHDLVDSFDLSLDEKSERYAQMLRALPPGVSAWAVHAGLGDDESRAIDPGGWRVRRSDYDFLMSTEARQLLRDEGIEVIDYRPLQAVWLRQKQADGARPDE
jgi:predicted glycoside hydrolase/deacetylase ChbG (UPF0249 family)